jgi:hypothetical protein
MGRERKESDEKGKKKGIRSFYVSFIFRSVIPVWDKSFKIQGVSVYNRYWEIAVM